ncbi:MAG: YncE family protein [Bacteroidales bacterium]|nr:YncE family protein [Bacteroidales bacterium]
MNRFFKYLFFTLIVFTVSCRKDKPEDNPDPQISIGNSGGVFITNEGNFQFGNAKVSYYDISTATVTEDLYQPANGVSLGDVCQSMCLFNGKAYIVVNNSGKVVVVNPLSFVTSATISGFTSPRYFLPVSNSKAYVTDLYANSVAIVNLSTNTITGNIPCAGWTEELALSYGKAFVTNQYRDKIYVINTSTDVLEDSMQVSYGSNSIKEDKNGKLWVLCSGKQSNSIYAGLYRINPLTKQVEQSFQFSNLSDSPWRLDINGTNDTLYFLNKGVYRMSIASGSLPNNAFIVEGSRNFYGIGIEPNTGVIYVADAIDYVQKGKIYRYKSDGTLINSFLAGIIPGDFYFN